MNMDRLTSADKIERMKGIIRIKGSEKRRIMRQYDSVIKKVLNRGQELGIYIIIRIQETKGKTIIVNNGKTEEIIFSEQKGMGFQVFTLSGSCGFACTDKIDADSALHMVELAANIAREMERRGGSLNREIFKLSPVQDTIYVQTEYPFNILSLESEENKILDFNKKIIDIYNNVFMESLYRNVVEYWRIVRSDGTDVSFNIPRAVISNTITAKGNNTVTTSSALSGKDGSLLFDEDKKQLLIRRTIKACQLAIDLLKAPKIKVDSCKLVIDYAMAKGLAHEAFGHAVETDNMKTSILGDIQGKFMKGRKVANSMVSIIDESLEGDYAYQPYSSNGLKRRKTLIVEGGLLNEALADIFSAEKAGAEITGAARVESYKHVPMPRMSNIRIEINNPIRIQKEFEEITPEELYKILLDHALITPGEKVLYLLGYRGGQVKTSQGEFVFNCSGIYELGETCRLYQPAIFSGKILSALESICAGIGPLLLDAQGTCGKAGQSVPSSGGSHYFVVMEANKEIIIGGEYI
jgi:TldD protein